MFLLNCLRYNGDLVGYRVDVVGKSFDVSLDDLKLLKQDFGLNPNMNRIGFDIILEDQGSQLVPKNAPNVQELTYGLYAERVGKEKMVKTDTELKRLYNYYNELCFNNELPSDVPVEWSTKMTSGAGICITSRRGFGGGYNFIIRLSVPYHDRFPNEIVDTLVHEMIHVRLPHEHHGKKFKEWMHRLNREFGFELTVKATDVATYKFVYKCLDCGYEYKRNKRINLDRATCGVGKCRGKLYQSENHLDDDFDADMDWGAGTEW